MLIYILSNDPNVLKIDDALATMRKTIYAFDSSLLIKNERVYKVNARSYLVDFTYITITRYS